MIPKRRQSQGMGGFKVGLGARTPPPQPTTKCCFADFSHRVENKIGRRASIKTRLIRGEGAVTFSSFQYNQQHFSIHMDRVGERQNGEGGCGITKLPKI